MKLESLNTPAALIDVAPMHRNIERMQQRMNTLGVSFRPHVKTSKCEQVVRSQIEAGARGITVIGSTPTTLAAEHLEGVTEVLTIGRSFPSPISRMAAIRAAGTAATPLEIA